LAPVMHLCGDTKPICKSLQLSIPALQKTSINLNLIIDGLAGFISGEEISYHVQATMD
jgi:hypothetical protein